MCLAVARKARHFNRLSTVCLPCPCVEEYHWALNRFYHPAVYRADTFSFFRREVNANVGGILRPTASALTPDVFEKKLRNGSFDFLIVEPHRVLEMEQLQYVVFAQAGAKDRIYGVIVTRDDTNVSKIHQLRGNTVCFGRKHALASTLLPRMWLQEAGFSGLGEDRFHWF